MTFEEFMQEINALPYLYLDRVFDLGDNEAVIELVAAKVEEGTPEDAEDIRAGFGEKTAELVKGCRRIVPDESRKWRLTFVNCIAFTVLNESYFSGDRGTVDKDGRVCVTENSDWLDYLRKASFAHRMIKGIRHFEIRCIDHIVNVAADREPPVERI